MQEIIVKINEELRAFGAKAVQEIKVGNMPPRYGYRPQYVFDAVNRHFGTENWKYEVLSKELFENQAVVEVKLFIKDQADEWLSKGSQIGQMTIIKGNVGDAYKGAITDAIQKCFSLLSIGSDAYKGLLKEVYFSNDKEHKPLPQEKPQQSNSQPDRQQKETTCPQIAGVQYQQRDGVIFAFASYEKKELLKSAGFRWDSKERAWCKKAA